MNTGKQLEKAIEEVKDDQDESENTSASLEEIIEDSDTLKEEIKAIVAQKVSHKIYHGPLPPASEFKKYGEILPDAPDRILAMAEEEQAHRHDMNKKVLQQESRMQPLGLVATFVGVHL